jgi:deoxyadenosine/deoxycytidine kinase
MDQSEADLGLPSLVIYLQCDAAEQLERIRVRGRAFEQGHDVAFIQAINRLVDAQVQRLEGLGVPLVGYRTDLFSWDEIAADLFERRLPAAGYRIHGSVAA